MNKIKISAVVNTRNEEVNIAECLQTLGFCNEIVVVDMESEDKTVQIAKDYTHKIFNHPNVDYVEPARNFAIKKATGDWILIVDADERISKDLAKALQKIANDGEFDFARIPRKNFIFGQWLQYSRWWPDYNVRFFKKGAVNWQDEIHSVPVTTGKGTNLDPVSTLAIEHIHYKSIDEYLLRTIRYANQQAKELIASGYKFEPTDIITKPISEFNSRFFAGEGYKDGFHGLVISLLQFFAILLVYLKVWEKDGHRPVKSANFLKTWQKSFADKFKEIRFWYLTTLIENSTSKASSIFFKFKRRLLK